MAEATTKRRPGVSGLTYGIGRAYLKAFGWTIEGELPADNKAVIIAAPHTSNWDLPFMLGAAWVFDLKLNWLGKHTLFEGPFGSFMTWLGGLPIDRRARHGAVAQTSEHIRKRDAIYLAIAPSGTRSKTECWKSGFYHIARESKVPIVLGFLDFERKVAGVGPAIRPTGDIKADMDRIRAFYRDVGGKKPELVTPIVLREELEGLKGATRRGEPGDGEPVDGEAGEPVPAIA
jgi:1-acyl-sn-glycerol-3-phosphate acyltransferase